MTGAGGTTGERGRALPDTARTARDTVRRRRLLRAAQRGDRSARDRIVRSHLRMVRPIASSYQELGLPLEDLIQEGTVGLLEAIDQYDPRRSASFESYARFRIRRAIRNGLTDKARLIRLPKQIVERRRALEQVEAKLSAAASGRPPTPSELAAATGLPLGAVDVARGAALAPISLDQPLHPDGGSLADLIADPEAADPELRLLEDEQMSILTEALQGLTARQRQVLAWRYGVGVDPASSVDMCRRLALSPRRMQTIQRDALYRLRRSLGASPAASAQRSAGDDARQ